MKALCYIAIIIAFLLFYQENPVYAIIAIVVFIGAYLFIKSRTSGSRSGVFGLFNRNQAYQDDRMNDLITLMMLQQLMGSSSKDNPIESNEKKEGRDQQLEKAKKEVLDLLEDV